MASSWSETERRRGLTIWSWRAWVRGQVPLKFAINSRSGTSSARSRIPTSQQTVQAYLNFFQNFLNLSECSWSTKIVPCALQNQLPSNAEKWSQLAFTSGQSVWYLQRWWSTHSPTPASNRWTGRNWPTRLTTSNGAARVIIATLSMRQMTNQQQRNYSPSNTEGPQWTRAKWKKNGQYILSIYRIWRCWNSRAINTLTLPPNEI